MSQFYAVLVIFMLINIALILKRQGKIPGPPAVSRYKKLLADTRHRTPVHTISTHEIDSDGEMRDFEDTPNVSRCVTPNIAPRLTVTGRESINTALVF